MCLILTQNFALPVLSGIWRFPPQWKHRYEFSWQHRQGVVWQGVFSCGQRAPPSERVAREICPKVIQSLHIPRGLKLVSHWAINRKPNTWPTLKSPLISTFPGSHLVWCNQAMEPGGLQSMGSLRVGHYWATSLSLFTFRIGEGNGNPLRCSCLENPRDGGAWWAAVYGVTQSRTRLKWLSSSNQAILEKAMAPLQYSCLENPTDGGAWWAAVHGVAKSRTRLSGFTFTFHFHALEKEMATHSSGLAWRIPGTVEPGGLPSVGSLRVGQDWSDLAAAAAATRLYMGLLYKTTGTVTSVIVTSVKYARENIVTFHCVLFSTIPGVISVWSKYQEWLCFSWAMVCLYFYFTKIQQWVTSHFPIGRNGFPSWFSENVFPRVLKPSKKYCPVCVFT